MKNTILKNLAFILAILLSSCSPKLAPKTAKVVEPVFYPQESDTARIQYLTSFSNSLSFTGRQSAFTSSIVGAQEVKNISKPYGVSIKHGKIYVCDVTLRGLEIIDLENKTFKHFIPQGGNSFELPLNCFIDVDSNIYVTDPNKGNIKVFDSNLLYQTKFGSKTLIKPTDIFIKNKRIYVVDIKNNRVNIFNQETHKFIDYFPKSVAGNEDWLYSPTNIYISESKIYVSDIGDTKIKIYSLKGEFLQSFGALGRGAGQFVRPKGIAVDKEEILYVVDGAFENVQMFNEKGQLLMFFGGPYKGPGDMYLPTQITIDYDNIQYFEKYVDSHYNLKYIIIVANQYGPDKISVYGRIELKR